MNHQSNQLEKIIGISCLFLLSIAYLAYLGYIPLVSGHDESRRALVALEMMISGDPVTPTINGELYLNKPPLYNWIIIGYFKLFGNYSMFVFRLPVMVAVFLTGYIVYFFTKKYTNQPIAFFTAFAYMTNGRILIYDSLFGLIDTTFSFLVYLLFMLVYEFGEKKKYYHLFLFTYTITALGFLLKGFPILLFQSITLLTWAISKKKIRQLFHRAHFIGIGLFLILLGTYYVMYFSKNNITPAKVFSNLFYESSKRTIIHRGVIESIIHVFSFPFEQLYHFAPWTLLFIAAFQKNVWKKIKENNFIYYSLLILFFNLVIYWASPRVHPRYLFMFIPLLYSILFYLFFQFLKERSWQYKTIRTILFSATILLFFLFSVLPFLDIARDRTFIYLRCFSLAGALAILIWIMLKHKAYFMYAFILAVIIFRIGFNWYILQERGQADFRAKAISQTISEITSRKQLFILGDSKIGNFDAMSFHISRQRKEILRKKDEFVPGTFYITDSIQVKGLHYNHYLSFSTAFSDSLMLVESK